MLIFLSGPMGSGKSTIAPLVAQRLGAPVIDLDARIAEREGRSVEELFHLRGEAVFRQLERAEAERVIASEKHAVVALGGGTVTDRESRRRLLDAGVLVTLTAPVDVLAARVAGETGRPLLAGRDARHVLERLLADRAAAYAECHAVVPTDGRDPDAIAEDVTRVAREAPVVVPLGERTYRIEIGEGVRDRLADRASRAAPGDLVVVTDAHVEELWGDELRALVAGAARRAVHVVLDAGEQHKDLAAIERIWDAALDAGVDRDALVIAAGGGVVGDVAGFAASTLLRGVAFGQLPTTLLAMVDSSVGGKTGIDRPQGKNLVGTFHQPSFVLCDVALLATLPKEERIAGLAEVVKSAWLDGEASVAMLERDAAPLRAGDPAAMARAIRMAVGLKARIVAEDEREGGARALLNLGHSVGHALEAASGYSLRHGDAVALGIVAAFRVAEKLGRATPEQGARAARLLSALGLPTDLDARLGDGSLRHLGSDKKRRGGRLRFVVPGAPGRTEIVPLAIDEVGRCVARTAGL